MRTWKAFGDDQIPLIAAGCTFYTLLALFPGITAIVLGLLTALWSANGATKAIISGLNIAYEEKEKRGFFGKLLVPLAFTLAFLVFVIAAVALAAVGAAFETRLGGSAGLIYRLAYSPVLFIATVIGMTVLYRFGPSRSRPLALDQLGQRAGLPRLAGHVSRLQFLRFQVRDL